MILDLVRHGHAVGTHPGGDAARTLSEHGRLEVARLAADLAGRGWRPECAFTSPLARARQTAALLLGVLESPPTPAVLASLEPEVAPAETLAELGAHAARASHVVVVSHLPLLGVLAKALTGADPGFEPATFVRVEFDGTLARGAGRLTLQIHPTTRT